MSVKEHLRLPREIKAVVLLCAIAFIHGVFCVRYVTKPVGISQKGEQSCKMIVTEWNKTLSESTQCSLVLKQFFVFLVSYPQLGKKGVAIDANA